MHDVMVLVNIRLGLPGMKVISFPCLVFMTYDLVVVVSCSVVTCDYDFCAS